MRFDWFMLLAWLLMAAFIIWFWMEVTYGIASLV